jgi:uncharacterized membrane protein HdeD (DUF308 family)
MALDDRSTMDVLRGSRITAYTIGALCVIAGLVLLFWPDRTTVVVARILGILFVVIGFGQIVEAITTHRQGNYWGLLLVRGILNLGFGLALLFWPDVTVTVIVWLIGLNLVLTGLIALIVSFRVPKDLGRGAFLLQAVITIVLGIVVMVWPSATLSVIAVLAGIILVLFGLVLLASGDSVAKARATTV